MNHESNDGHGRSHSSRELSIDHDQRRVLDLDAEVFGENLAAALDLVGKSAAHSIVDLGAGTGAGSRLLSARYPDAVVTCVDNDPRMLEMLRHQGFAVIEADLDEGLPAVGGLAEATVDLVWASSSLHHVAHPARLLAAIHRALAPAGVLVVVELAGLPGFLGDSAEAALEQRCHDAAASAGWNHHPDWTPTIEAAGFTVIRSEVETVSSVTPTAREYARQWFARFLHLEALTADDRNGVEDLLDRMTGGLELHPRAVRTVWVAQRSSSSGSAA